MLLALRSVSSLMLVTTRTAFACSKEKEVCTWPISLYSHVLPDMGDAMDNALGFI